MMGFLIAETCQQSVNIWHKQIPSHAIGVFAANINYKDDLHHNQTHFTPSVNPHTLPVSLVNVQQTAGKDTDQQNENTSFST